MFKSKNVTVNGRSYRWPSRPVVAVCVDGSEPDYIEKAMAAGRMPWTEQVVTGGGVDLRVDRLRNMEFVGIFIMTRNAIVKL